MSAVQTTLYKQILLRDIDTVNGGANASGSRTQILNICMQLRKCCNHPYLFPGVEDRSMDPLGDHLVTSCGKMVLLDKLLIKMKQRDHRVLIFSQMTRMLDILEDYLISKGYLYCRIDGNTSYDVSYIFN
jgi:SWI/SNF-related matrix-associated actin-dependent regulator of chromatin subfamily A member 5